MPVSTHTSRLQHPGRRPLTAHQAGLAQSSHLESMTLLRQCDADALSRVVLILWLAGQIVLSFGCHSTQSRSYPSKPIRLIVQTVPGGLSDAVSRVMASQLELQLGVPVVCENRPGAAGAVAFLYVVRQRPDGYLLGHGPVEIAMVQALGLAQVGPKDMDLLCLVSMSDPVLAVHSASSWKTFNALVESARTRPGYYIIGNSGTGSIWHINALLLEEATRTQFVHCPFGGSAAAITALLGRHVDAVVAGAGEVAPYVQAGSLRALAVFSAQRSPVLPDVPAVRELGWDFGTPAWSGFYAPKGLPDPVRSRLVGAFKKAFESEAFQRLCRERGMRAVFLGPDEFRVFVDGQTQFFESAIPRLITRAWAVQ